MQHPYTIARRVLAGARPELEDMGLSFEDSVLSLLATVLTGLFEGSERGEVEQKSMELLFPLLLTRRSEYLGMRFLLEAGGHLSLVNAARPHGSPEAALPSCVWCEGVTDDFTCARCYDENVRPPVQSAERLYRAQVRRRLQLAPAVAVPELWRHVVAYCEGRDRALSAVLAQARPLTLHRTGALCVSAATCTEALQYFVPAWRTWWCIAACRSSATTFSARRTPAPQAPWCSPPARTSTAREASPAPDAVPPWKGMQTHAGRASDEWLVLSAPRVLGRPPWQAYLDTALFRLGRPLEQPPMPPVLASHVPPALAPHLGECISFLMSLCVRHPFQDLATTYGAERLRAYLVSLLDASLMGLDALSGRREPAAAPLLVAVAHLRALREQFVAWSPSDEVPEELGALARRALEAAEYPAPPEDDSLVQLPC